MTRQFARKSIAAALTTAALAFAITPVGAADQSDHWFEQQPPAMQYAPLMPVVGEPIRVEPLVYCHALGGVVTDGKCVKREVQK